MCFEVSNSVNQESEFKYRSNVSVVDAPRQHLSERKVLQRTTYNFERNPEGVRTSEW